MDTLRGRGCIPVSTHAMRGSKVQFITDWAQRVNRSYSLFNIEKLWTLRGSVSCYSAFRYHAAESLSLASTDRLGGREPPHLWVSLLPRKPCLAHLTPVPDDITCPELFTHKERFSSMMSLDPDWFVWGWREGGTEAQMQVCGQISAVNNHRPVGSLTQNLSSDREGYICFCLLWMCLVSLPVFPISGLKKKLCG